MSCAGHGILGGKSAVFAGKALARHIFSGFLRNKHLVRMEEADVVAEILVGAWAVWHPVVWCGAHTFR
jgi:hypothetical protein